VVCPDREIWLSSTRCPAFADTPGEGHEKQEKIIRTFFKDYRIYKRYIALMCRNPIFTKKSPVYIRIPVGQGDPYDLFPVFICHPALSFEKQQGDAIVCARIS
jgi:hypothetical protein